MNIEKHGYTQFYVAFDNYKHVFTYMNILSNILKTFGMQKYFFGAKTKLDPWPVSCFSAPCVEFHQNALPLQVFQGPCE